MMQKNPDTKAYPEFDQLNLPAIERGVLEFWKEKDIFKKSISSRPMDKPFVFYEGPPSANGKPGIHHVMSRTIKDLFCRFKTLQGYRVERKAGWDTHGLPVELNVEKQLGITKADIGTKISVAEYNKLCREDVMKFTDVWEDLTNKMGYWVDMEHPYVTYTNDYIESLWALLKMLYDKGLLYEGYTIQPYSPAAGTGLSSHELNQPGCYRIVKDVTAVAMFKVTRDDKSNFLFDEDDEDVRFLAWTTTPWTLPSNTALALGKDIEYITIKTISPFTGERVTIILAKEIMFSINFMEQLEQWICETLLLGEKKKDKKDKYDGYSKDKLPVEVKLSGNPTSLAEFSDKISKDGYNKGIYFSINPFNIREIPENVEVQTLTNFPGTYKVYKGSELQGIRYEQLLPYAQPKDGDAFSVVLGDFVTTSDGTGIVHIAPSFGSDDFRVAKQNGIGSLTLVDKQGRFTDEVNDPVFPLDGRYVKEDYYTDEEKQADFHLQKEILRVNNVIPDLKSHIGVDELIVLKLKLENKLFKTEKYEHSYPHCWRTDKPVIYYPLDSWFIKTTAAKDRLIELNKTINWKPKSTGEGRFGQWLENLVDWNLSRSRYWGTPLPVWRDEVYHYVHVVGKKSELLGGEVSQLQGLAHNRKNVQEINEVRHEVKPIKVDGYLVSDELKIMFTKFCNNQQDIIREVSEKSRWGANVVNNYIQIAQSSIIKFIRLFPEDTIVKLNKITADSLVNIDFHKPHVDDIVFIGDRGFAMDKVVLSRVPDLVDVWFDSGAMPYAQWHWPFAPNKAPFGGLGAFPADFISEGVDQTRGWFFTLHVLATMLFDSVAYKNVVSNGLILDKNGNKMSKRLGNVIDPFEAIHTHSADAIRWYMMRNSDPWENMKFDVAGLQDVVRSHYGTLYNTYSFFALYANIDNWQLDEKNRVPHAAKPELDRWILSKLQSLVKEVTGFYEDYEPTKAARAIEVFVDEHLSNWYVRLSRRRFWKGEMSTDKSSAYETLYDCLFTVSQLMSPISPFFSEWLYRNLTTATGGEESIHLTSLVQPKSSQIDADLEERMELAQRTCSLVLSLRKKEKIKVRQPLHKIMIPVLNDKMKEQLTKVESYILSEVNVKAIEYIHDTAGIVKKKIKPNFRELGKKVGAKMKALQTAIAAFTQEDLQKLERDKTFALNLEGQPFNLDFTDVEILSEDIPGWLVASDGPITVALDVTITDELRNEGNAREFVNKVQNLRKDKGFQVLDRIRVSVVKNETLEEALKQFKDYIRNEILARDIVLVESLSHFDEVELNDEVLKVKVELN